MTGVVRVLDKGVLTPVPGVDVVYYREGSPLGVSVTDSEGRYRLLGVPAGEYRLEAGLNTRDRTSLTGHSVAGQNLVQNLVIEILDYESYGTVKGTIRRRDGSRWPRPGSRQHRVDSGRLVQGYELAGSLSNEERGSKRSARRAPVGLDELLRDPAGRGRRARTTSKSRDSGPPSRCWIRRSRWPGPRWGCKAAAPVRVLVHEHRRRGLAQFRPRLRPVSARAVVESEPGRWDSAVGTVTVVSEDGPAVGQIKLGGFGTVTGVVLNPDGEPSHGASVELVAQRFVNGSGVCGFLNEALPPVHTDTKGEFRFENVHVGPIQVRASSTVFPTAVSDSGQVEAAGANTHFKLRLVDNVTRWRACCRASSSCRTASPRGLGRRVTAAGPVRGHQSDRRRRSLPVARAAGATG
jgi:hypothetical protein